MPLPNTRVIHPAWDARFRWRHTLLVEAYRGWNDYAPPATVACLIKEHRDTSTPNPGSPRITEITVTAPDGTVLPAGSRVTLPDGRRGHASALVEHDGGGLRYDGSVEVTVIVGTAYGPPFGETVILLRRGQAVRDTAGSTTYPPTPVNVGGCAVRLLTATETHERLGHDTGVEMVEVIMPPGTTVTAADKLLVRGLAYDVDGVPQPITDAMTDAEPGTRVIGRRTHTI